LDGLAHDRGVADERLVVEQLEDLLVCHAACSPVCMCTCPASEGTTRRRLSRAASSFSTGTRRAISPGPRRSVGPEIESAATTTPPPPRTGAAIAARPAS